MQPSALALQFGTGINYAAPRDVYPSAPGATVSQVASAQTPYTTDAVTAAGDGATIEGPAGAVASSSARSLVVTMLTIIALFIGLGFVGHKLGGREGETGVANLRLSGYNIAYITLASAIGIGLLKIAFTRWRIPGLSTYVGAL